MSCDLIDDWDFDNELVLNFSRDRVFLVQFYYDNRMMDNVVEYIEHDHQTE